MVNLTRITKVKHCSGLTMTASKSLPNSTANRYLQAFKKMKTILYIITVLFLVSCQDNKKQNQENNLSNTENDALESLSVEKGSPPLTEEAIKNMEFDIQNFQQQCDSLLKRFKGDRYSFEMKSDTFNYLTDNAEEFTKGHGIFWQLYRDSSERIVRNYLFDPKTKKQFRIYLVEADYADSRHLDSKLAELETSMNDSINAPDCNDYKKWKLSPVSDYIIVSDKKLFWLNISYPFSNKEFLKFVDCLKNNIDTTKYKGRIICLFGSDCRVKNVP
jgi:hypothetical protein